ncbi:hypothetical protein [Alienimonas chondri]|uniref:Uncharacterized protein n=1 Tax=Alienimonas chondri TaxID=2681879 RepID=A0ABX1VBD3_9PLAN|nr:hypothetical protein [Alienimonas chondri]NNJ25083.1 hypothetical protein [Alienimonas chondri]
MRKHSPRSRYSALCPLLAAGVLIGWTTGCAGLSGVLPPFGSSAEAVAAAEDAEQDGLKEGSPAPPIAPPAESFRESSASSTAQTMRTPETEALIVEELSLAPADERTQLAAEWSKLDEAMVEQVIRIRRMVRQLDQNAARPEFAASATGAPLSGSSDRLAPAPVDTPFAASEHGRVFAGGPEQLPVEISQPARLTDSQVRPAAYMAPAPPIDRADAPRPRGSSLFPGLPPGAESAAAQEPTPLVPPPRREGQPTRVAEALPSSAALMSPSAMGRDQNSASPLYDPGPTGFGGEQMLPDSPVDDFDGRLDALEQTARRRASRAAEAVRNAVTSEEKRIAERQRAEAEIHLRLLHLIAGEHGRALEAVPGLPPAEQEFWQNAIWALSTEMDIDSIPDPADRATHAVAALRVAALKLSEKANLSLKDVNFCHRVDSFGNVQTFERDEFTPNEPVLIYAAVENFTSERTLEGRFRTVLRSKVEIFRAGGTELVETLPLDKPMTEDLCDNHRQDYFLIYELKIPARIGLGPHVLKLTVEDTLGNATAETELNFTVR